MLLLAYWPLPQDVGESSREEKCVLANEIHVTIIDTAVDDWLLAVVYSGCNECAVR